MALSASLKYNIHEYNIHACGNLYAYYNLFSRN